MNTAYSRLVHAAFMCQRHERWVWDTGYTAVQVGRCVCGFWIAHRSASQRTASRVVDTTQQSRVILSSTTSTLLRPTHSPAAVPELVEYCMYVQYNTRHHRRHNSRPRSRGGCETTLRNPDRIASNRIARFAECWVQQCGVYPQLRSAERTYVRRDENGWALYHTCSCAERVDSNSRHQNSLRAGADGWIRYDTRSCTKAESASLIWLAVSA